MGCSLQAATTPNINKDCRYTIYYNASIPKTGTILTSPEEDNMIVITRWNNDNLGIVSKMNININRYMA